MSRKILVPLDGAEGSETVLHEVARMARAEQAIVRLVYVSPPAEAEIVDGRVLRYADQEAARITFEARRYLTGVAAGLAGLEVEVAVRFGEPVEEIVREAQASGTDLIAMATHHRAGFDRMWNGSVAEEVGRRASLPVLLVGYAMATA
jgi:nucleotide-binding universal stress UspA family protein